MVARTRNRWREWYLGPLSLLLQWQGVPFTHRFKYTIWVTAHIFLLSEVLLCSILFLSKGSSVEAIGCDWWGGSRSGSVFFTI